MTKENGKRRAIEESLVTECDNLLFDLHVKYERGSKPQERQDMANTATVVLALREMLKYYDEVTHKGENDVE